uniref:Retrovirus-related Pol polyprotein from transposon TNT 1-94 n=1 Tax=Tanacetum cinerariifolium TaxID=118510 RepID=A0A6L2M1X9_TANCI|nr:retrovirus-related Pol polyprotein from transposon TNT 1-94 [Tanacetum cinerariifolium]
MEAGATTTMTVKLPILNPGEYDHWLMMIEQYFLMTDYSIWEVIKNGSKVLTKPVGSSEQTYEPTTTLEKQDRRNEMMQNYSWKLLRRGMEETKNQRRFRGHFSNNIMRTLQHQEIAMLTIRARRFMKRPSRSLDMNGRRIGFDKTKVECFNCHKNDYFSKEYRAPRNQDNKGRKYGRTTVPVETPIENALIAQDGMEGYDWSYQAEEETLTNYAFMAFTSSRSSSSSDSEVDSLSKTCMKAYADLKNEYDSLTSDYKKSQQKLFSYKAGLQSVEERFVHYKKNEVVFTEKINVLNLKVKLMDKVLAEYTQNLEKVEKERDELKFTLEKLQNSSKSLNTLLNNQISDKSKASLGYKEQIPESFVNSFELLEKLTNRSTKGYHEVPPLLTWNYMPLKRDLRLIDEHFEKDLHSDDDSEDELSPTVKVKTVKPSVEKIKSIKTHRETIKTAESHKPHKHYPRGNKRNWNNLMPIDLEVNLCSKIKLVMCVTALSIFNMCVIKRIGFVSQAVLTGSTKINTAAASVNTAQTSPFNKLSSNKKCVFNKKVNTVRVNDSTARERAVVSGNMGREGNPQQKEYEEKGVIDSGCFRHMTGNKCYLTDFEAFDGGFVSFGDGKGRISGKGKIKTRKLDFDDVYFCKELKYNLFSMSQMCDKKNNVIFTDTECLVLSFNFKLLDESQVLLRVPRKDNIYSVDLKLVVPTGGLTCLFAKATLDESNLWHRRLGHINFKTINKLVKRNLFYDDNCIKREYNVAKTPQQNEVAERRNRTLIEAARTMLVYSKLPTTFWAEAVNTACYVLNRALVTKPHNKTPYELIRGRPPLIDFMKPFGCHVTILNTRDNLGKFEGKADEGYFVGYSVVSKAIRVFNKRTMILEETLNIRFQENTNGIAGTKEKLVAGQDKKQKELAQEYILIPICTTGPLISQDAKDSAEDARKKAPEQDKQTEHNNSTNDINVVSSLVSTARPSFVNATLQIPLNAAGSSTSTNAFDEHSFERFSPFKNAFSLLYVPMVNPIDDNGIFGNAYDDDVFEEEVDMNNVDSSYAIHEATKFLKDHLQEQVIRSLETLIQTRHMSKTHEEFGLLSSVHKLMRTNHKDFQIYLFACFLYQIEPKKPVQAIQDPSLVEAMQEELLRFKLNKKDERGIVIKNKARLVSQGHTQEEVIGYDEVFAPVARIEAIRGQIDKTLFIKRHKDDIMLVQVYVDDIIFGSTKKELRIEFEKLMHDKFRISSIRELSFFLGLQVKQKSDGIFISQDKYMAEILKKFNFVIVKSASTPMESNKSLTKDVDVYLYRSMIGSLMYLTVSRHDITFAVCACARFQVTPKTSHLYVMKRIFRYLKGQPKLGLWYPKDLPFDLKVYSDSDYDGANLDRKSTTRGCQFLGKRLISWQCKKHTVVANSTTEAEYVAAAN